MKLTENHERSDAAAIEAEAMAWLAEREEGFAPGRAGAMNMAGQLGSFLTTVLFGYLVNAFGSYNAPLVPKKCRVAVPPNVLPLLLCQ